MRTNAGFILWLDLETRKRIHKLTRDYAIDQDSQFRCEGFSPEKGNAYWYERVIKNGNLSFLDRN